MGWFHKRRRRFTDRLFRRIAYSYFARDLLLDLQLDAKREAVAYIKKHMVHCRIFPTRWDLLRDAVDAAGLDGLFLEFGVYKGNTIRAIASGTRRGVHGFDSFEGLPEDWQGTMERRGAFDMKGRLPRVPANVTLHRGWFDQTLAPFLDEHGGPVAFVHMDCDLYASSKTVLELIGPRLVPGTVMVFDDYFNYPNWQAHEFRAFQELVGARKLAYDYVGFTARGGTVLIKITGEGAP